MKHFFVLIVLLSCTLGFAQKPKDFDIKYNEAVEKYRQGDLDRASILFGALMELNPSNQYVEESSYMLALIDFKNQKIKESYQALLQLKNTYPKWENIDEVNYLLGNIAFINQDYELGMRYCSLLKDEKVKISANKMKLNYLSAIKETAKLKDLHQKFSDDSALGQILASRLAEQDFLSKSDEFLLNYLKQTFVLDESLKTRIEKMSSYQQKNKYHVAVLMPFFYDDLKQITFANDYQYAVDCRNGILMALDSLKTDKIELHFYDTKKDTNALKKILALPEFQQIDFIIGPIFADENEIVSKYCNKNMLAKLNLLSKKPTETDSIFGFYTESTFKHKAERSAQVCIDSIGKEGIVLVANNYAEDSVFVKAFTEKFNALGGQKLKTIVLDKFNTMHTKLNEMAINDTNLYKGIVIANSKNNTISNISSFYTAHNLTTPLVIPSDWVESKQFVLKAYKFTSVYLIGMTPDNLAKSIFADYLTKYGIPPSNHAFIGYKSAHYFMGNLLKYGRYFNTEITSINNNNGGFNYYQSNTNTYIPVVKLKNNEFISLENIYDTQTDK